MIALEAAKPLKTARLEVERTITTYKFAAEEAKQIHGETIPMDAAPGGEKPHRLSTPSTPADDCGHHSINSRSMHYASDRPALAAAIPWY